jgi:hypothetical protein
MDVGLYSTLFGLGLAGGIASGLVGLGGGIIMVPLLLYVPPAIGVATLPMKIVAGMTSVQSFAGALSGAFGHKRHNRISQPLALWLGVPMTAGSLAGSIASNALSSDLMLLVFAAMAVVAAVMMVLPKPESHEEPDPAHVTFNRTLTVAVGLVVGVLSGIVGQGGSFLFIPAMLYLLHIPTRIAIGTALAVGIASSVAVLLGRFGTNQIPFAMSAFLVAGVLIGAQLGSHLSQRTPRRVLRGVLSALIAATAAKIWYQLVVA